jgi:3-phenylpropionate/trans-cinnamate dioxygenase ferredoxin reductase subunit
MMFFIARGFCGANNSCWSSIKRKEKFMPHFEYLIVGGGMTADAAVEGIREIDSEGSIAMISAENNPPYDRPPLTKGLWTGKSLRDIWRGTSESQADVHLGRKIESLELENKTATDDQNAVYTYNKLLLATGGNPRKLPFGQEHIIYYRTLEDYKEVRELTQNAQHFAVIGSGFIGSELSAALAMNDQQVSLIFPGDGIGARIFPPELSQFLNQYYREKGIDVLQGTTVTGLKEEGEKLVLTTEAGKNIAVDAVVAGIGIIANTELAEAAGLKVEDGIIVDDFLRASHPDVYAAGDVASFFNPALGKRMRVEHEDNANTMGKVAGKNMAGEPTPYHYLPYFYSDLFDMGYEAVGDLDSRLETVSDWQEPYKKGIVYYLQDARVRGVLAWNVWDQVDPARELIAEPGPFTVEDVRRRLPA